MIRSDEFFETLTSAMKKYNYKSEVVKGISKDLNDKYEIPEGILIDYLTLRVPIDDANEFILYVLAEQFMHPVNIKTFFSEKEIEILSRSKYKEEKLKFPLTFNMIQIAYDQWIGRITVKELMKLRDAQIINYNERTQRTMERKISHGHEYYQIAINDSVVDDIQSNYENGNYIPNTITLNIPEDDENDFYYNDEEKKLVIKAIKFFDILDGYHRYRAMSKAYINSKKRFDYDMELRIVNFDETRAKQFIWQEDQKTKMAKIDSNSFNQNDQSVYICEKLSREFPPGTISRNQGIIDLPQLIIAVRHFYDTKNKKSGEVNKIVKDLTAKFNSIIDDDPALLNKKWKRSFIFCVICCCYYLEEDICSKAKLLDKLSGGEVGDYIWRNEFNTRKVTALKKILDDEVRTEKGRR